ncbi:MAG: alpha/beta hydrolase [Hyphomonadaceae bacterium]
MRLLGLVVALTLACGDASAQEREPRIEHIRSQDGAEIAAHIFDPAPKPGPRAAIVLLHGGGWVAGDATWVYPRARRFAELGMLAIALDYRLANQADVTPAHATADARATFRWLRENAERLNIDPTRLAAYGVSAGGQLSVTAAQSEDERARPNLLVLLSPALDVERDAWFIRLSGAATRALSPLANVRPDMPAAFILQGDVDTLTPLTGARAFCERMIAAANRCEIRVYEGFGHLFTPAGIDDQGMPQPDPTTSRASAEEAEAYLRREGYIR